MNNQLTSEFHSADKCIKMLNYTILGKGNENYNSSELLKNP